MLSALTVLALAVAAQAAPAEVAGRATKSFSLPAVHNGAARNGTASLLKAYKKFNLTPSQEFSDSFLAELQGSNFKKQRSVGNARRQDGSVTASPDPNDVEYLVSVSIGGQNLNLDFDTGSADL
jgi:aspergillopepsin I